MSLRTLAFTSSALLLATVAACSSEGGTDSSTTGGTGATTGGATSGSGGATAAGGTGTTTGGSSNSGGSPGTGGNAPTGFQCPAGSESIVVDLTGKEADEIALAPNLPDGIEGNSQVFLEGPVWIDGSLYVSAIRQYGDQPPAAILKLTGTTLAPHIPDAGTNGLAVRNDGTLVAASHEYFGLVTFDVNAPTAAHGVVVDEYDSESFNSPNDLAIRDDGNIYFTDPSYQCGSNCGQGTGTGQKRVYWVSNTTPPVVTAIASPHDQPNGIALSPDGNTLYVAGSSAIQKYTVGSDGAVQGTNCDTTNCGTEFANASGIDGLAIDCAGNVYATAHSEGNIKVYSPTGQSLGTIQVGQNVTNAAFGGPENKTLYVTTYTKALHSVELNIPGYPY